MMTGLSDRTFQFRPILTAFAALGLVVLLSLGSWQLTRLEWKKELIDRVEARVDQPTTEFSEIYSQWQGGGDLEYTPVHVRWRLRQ